MTNNDNRVTGGLVIVTSERGGYIGQTDERDIYLYVRRNLFCFSKSKKKKEDDEHFRQVANRVLFGKTQISKQRPQCVRVCVQPNKRSQNKQNTDAVIIITVLINISMFPYLFGSCFGGQLRSQQSQKSKDDGGHQHSQVTIQWMINNQPNKKWRQRGEQKEKENEGNKRVTMRLVVVERDLREPLVDNKPTTCEDK